MAGNNVDSEVKNHVKYVVSGCLAGLKCRYDGGTNPCEAVIELCRLGKAVPVCPESLSGLPVPREPCEQKHGKVISRNGEDVTERFEIGANLALEKALASGARLAILKSKSPSCGYGQIYDGTFSKKLCAGNGIWTEKLINAGFKVFDENNLPEVIGR